MAFETQRMIIRRLKNSDLSALHEMQGNAKVMHFIGGKPRTWQEDEKELARVIDKYSAPENTFWVWAAERNILTKKKIV